jgi:hypothetical protein
MAGKMNATAAAAEPVRRAYVTFLPGADDGEGLKAVVRQAEDLRKVDAAYPLVVAVLPDVPESHRRILVLQGCVVREVEPVYPPAEFSAMSAAPRYSMLRVWEVGNNPGLIHVHGAPHRYFPHSSFVVLSRLCGFPLCLVRACCFEDVFFFLFL